MSEPINYGKHWSEVLKELNAENTRLKADLTDCKAESDRLKAEVERSTAQYNGIIDTQLKVIDELKAEVESLKKPAVIGGYNISEYIRMANSETLDFDNGDIFADMTLPERIKYIVESHASLKAEVERLTDSITRGAITPDAKPAEPDPDYLTVYLYAAELAKDSMKKVKSENAFLKMEVERLKNNAAYLDKKLDEELDK